MADSGSCVKRQVTSISIPHDEATFYEKVGCELATELKRLKSFDQYCGNDSIIKTLSSLARNRPQFLNPKRDWLNSTYERTAEYSAYRFVAPLRGKKVLQIGGTGTHAVRFALAGASEAALLSPVKSELSVAKEYARLAGVDIRCFEGVAEQAPFDDASFDVVHAGGCAHHFDTSVAFHEISRLLPPGGKFTAVEPWRAPLYAIGTKILGKREKDVHCRPLDALRVSQLYNCFRDVQVVQHGTFFRYLAITSGKFGIPGSFWWVWPLMRADDMIASSLRLRRFGSSVVLMAQK